MVDYLTPEEVADLLSVSKATLRRWRQQGKGPPWIRIGKRIIRYDKRKLERWAREEE